MGFRSMIKNATERLLDNGDYEEEYEYDEEYDESYEEEYEGEYDESYEEEYSDEYYEDAENAEYVEESAGEYSEEQYEEEYEPEYYEKAEYYPEEEYQGEYYEEEYYEEDPDYDPSIEDYEPEDSIINKLIDKIIDMQPLDRVIALSAVVVVIFAIGAGLFFFGNKGKGNSDFKKTVGVELVDVTSIGGDNINAIILARMNREGDAEEILDAEIAPEYEEEEFSNSVTVDVKLTSILKDLKIKFINKKTGKLIANVPFEVTVTNPNGDSQVWTDTDKDGIIYKDGITSGNYSVSMKALSDNDKYKSSAINQTIKVRESIEYKKVDVSDEVKSESQIDVSKEDTAKKDAEESKLEDTVAWVESTQTSLGETYVEISKDSINVPAYAYAGTFLQCAGANGETVSISGGDGTVSGSTTLSASASGFEGDVKYSWSVTGTSGVNATLSSSEGASVTLTASNTNTTASNVTVTVTATSEKKETKDVEKEVEVEKEQEVVDPETGEKVIDEETGEVKKEKVKVKEKQTVPEEVTTTYSDTATKTISIAPTVKAEPTLSPTSLTLKEGESGSITISNAANASDYTWSSSSDAVAKVSGTNNGATITAVKKGSATITCKYKKDGTDKSLTVTVNVNANPANDTTSLLKDKSGNQVYVVSGGNYVNATYADYFKSGTKFYIKQAAGYKYTGWQTLDGKTYFFDANGNKITGAQVIHGVQYSFDNSGVLVSSNGILGIDVSKWNGSIDWKKVKNSGVSFVIIRCGYRGSTQGSLIEDPNFRSYIKGASDAGLKVGIYFFTQAVNEVEAVEEASMVISMASGSKIGYPIFLDVESSGGRGDGIDKTTRTAVCKAFCQTIQNSGYTAGIYANKSWLKNNIDPSQLGSYKIWLAHYCKQTDYSGRYEMWQYTSTGSISGISGNVDLDLSYLGY